MICAEKAPSWGNGYIKLREKYVHFNISYLFTVDNNSFLKLVFPIAYCFCLDSHLSGCVVIIIIVAVAFFFCYCNLSLLSWLSSLLLLLLCVSYITVNIVDKF